MTFSIHSGGGSSYESPTGASAEIELLKRLVEIETPSLDTTASARIAAVLDTHFTDIGATVHTIPTDAGTSLLIEASGTGAPLLLLGHTDTVWPSGTLAGSVPWKHEGDRIAGPGVYDMKSGIVVMHTALSRLVAQEHRAVRILLVCDEEIGSPTTQALLREAASGISGALGFESPHPDGNLKVGRRGSSRVRLTVAGHAAHAALDPSLGVSAIDELVDQLIFVRHITSEETLRSRVLCNVGRLQGGARTNVVPDTASAEIGLRFSDSETEQRVLTELRTLSPIRDGARVRFELLSHRPAWNPDAQDHRLLEAIRIAAKRTDQQIGGYPAAGAGDTNLIGSLGIPTLDGLGPRGGGAHAENEHILTSSLFERIDLLAAILSQENAAPAGQNDVGAVHANGS